MINLCTLVGMGRQVARFLFVVSVMNIKLNLNGPDSRVYERK